MESAGFLWNWLLPSSLPALRVFTGFGPAAAGGGTERKGNQQVQDLQKHGISNILLDAWTVPVPLAKDGTPDTRHFDRALAWLKEEGLNRQVLIYGLLGPLLRDIGKAAGTDDYRRRRNFRRFSFLFLKHWRFMRNGRDFRSISTARMSRIFTLDTVCI
ncbi:MAG: hypothetical protein V8T87_04185 [Victivallales bacterium]